MDATLLSLLCSKISRTLDEVVSIPRVWWAEFSSDLICFASLPYLPWLGYGHTILQPLISPNPLLTSLYLVSPKDHSAKPPPYNFPSVFNVQFASFSPELFLWWNECYLGWRPDLPPLLGRNLGLWDFRDVKRARRNSPILIGWVGPLKFWGLCRSRTLERDFWSCALPLRKCNNQYIATNLPIGKYSSRKLFR